MEPNARQRSIHIDAPAEMVFDHVKNPDSFVAADPEPVQLSNLSLTPEGAGSTGETHGEPSAASFTESGPAASTSRTNVSWTTYPLAPLGPTPPRQTRTARR